MMLQSVASINYCYQPSELVFYCLAFSAAVDGQFASGASLQQVWFSQPLAVIAGRKKVEHLDPDRIVHLYYGCDRSIKS